MSRIKIAAIAALVFFHAGAQALVLDVWNSTDPNNYVLIGQITTIDTAEIGHSHYDHYTAHRPTRAVCPWRVTPATSGCIRTPAPASCRSGLSLVKTIAVPAARSSADFRIVGSATNPYVSRSDDPGEAVETPPGSNAYAGNFFYGNNTDGIMVSGISRLAWTIIVDAVDFGPHINVWTAVSGDM